MTWDPNATHKRDAEHLDARRPRASASRTVALVLASLTLSLSGCAEDGTPSGSTGSPTVDEARIGVYAAVIRDVIEFRTDPVYVWTELCSSAEGAAFGDDLEACPDSLSSSEQEAIASVLAADVPQLEFVQEAEAIAQDIFDHGGAELVRLGPIEEVEGRTQVAASHVCGNLCGSGSVWVVEETEDGWAITGPAPGHGVWIS